MTYLDDKQLEESLSQLPEFKMGKTAEVRFYMKLFGRYFGSVGIFSKKAFALSLAVLLLMFGGGTVFSLQPEVTRGHFLYPLKQLEEKAEFVLASKPLTEVRAHLRFANRRLKELEVLTGNRPQAMLIPIAAAQEANTLPPASEHIEKTANDMVNSTESAMKTAETIALPLDAFIALNEITKTQDFQTQALAKVIKSKPHAVLEQIFQHTLIVTASNQSAVAQAQTDVEQAMAGSKNEVHLSFALATTETENKFKNFDELKEAARLELAAAKSAFEAMEKEFKDKEFSEQETQLLNRAMKKIQSSQDLIDHERYGRAHGLAKASQGLMNNFRGITSSAGAKATTPAPAPAQQEEAKKESAGNDENTKLKKEEKKEDEKKERETKNDENKKDQKPAKQYYTQPIKKGPYTSEAKRKPYSSPPFKKKLP